MQQDEIHTGAGPDSALDSIAAVTLILLAVATAVFWVSTR